MVKNTLAQFNPTCDKYSTTYPCAEDIRYHRQCHIHIGCSETKHYLCPINKIYLFIHLARMFGKINTGSKHSSYVGVSLIKTFLDYRLNKRKIGYSEYFVEDHS